MTRTQRILQQANEYLAHTSSHKIGITDTSQGCIKILSSYGHEYAEIAAMAGVPLDSVKSIASGRKSGVKSLEKLQQAVQQIEQLQMNMRPLPIEASIREELNKLIEINPVNGTPEWIRMRKLSNRLKDITGESSLPNTS